MTSAQPSTSEAPPTDSMSYEQARDELRSIVQALETGNAPLEETLRLWQRGEELSRHCQHILQNAQRKVDEAVASGEEEAANTVE